MNVTTIGGVKQQTALDPIPLVEISANGERYQEPLILTTFGNEGGGKSRLIGTAPGDIGLIPMETKSRQSVLDAAAQFGRRVIAPERDLIRVHDPILISMLPAACVTEDKFKGMRPEDAVKAASREMEALSKTIKLDGVQPDCCAQHYYRWHINRIKSVAFRMAAMESIRTIGIDTFGQFVEDMLFANYGRTDRIMPLDKKSFNQEVRDFLNAISHKNLILTHHAAQVWADNKPTSRWKPASSFSKIGHYTSVAVRQERNKNPREGEPTYTLSCLDCQANASLIGCDLLYDADIIFKNISEMVYPDAPEGYFD